MSLTFSACQFLTWSSLLTEPQPHMLAIYHHHLFWKRPFFHAKLGLDVCPKSSLSTYPKNSPLRMQTKQLHVIPHTLFPRLPFLPWPLAPSTTNPLQADTQSSTLPLLFRYLLIIQQHLLYLFLLLDILFLSQILTEKIIYLVIYLVRPNQSTLRVGLGPSGHQSISETFFIFFSSSNLFLNVFTEPAEITSSLRNSKNSMLPLPLSLFQFLFQVWQI